MADNSMQYWSDGFPYQGIQDNTNGTGGTMQFWDQGFPYQFIFPPAAATNVTQVLMCLGVGT